MKEKDIDFMEWCLFNIKNTQIINNIISQVMEIWWMDIINYKPVKNDEINHKLRIILFDFQNNILELQNSIAIWK